MKIYDWHIAPTLRRLHIYEEGMLAASELFRNTHPAFADRGLPRFAEAIQQHPYLVERAKARLGRFYRKFDAQLANNVSSQAIATPLPMRRPCARSISANGLNSICRQNVSTCGAGTTPYRRVRARKRNRS